MDFDLICKKYGCSVDKKDAKGAFAGVYKTPNDIIVISELTGGIYNGERGRLDSPCNECAGKGCQEAFDTEKYSWKQIERVLRIAFEVAFSRNGKLCIADKADILESSRLWREAAEEVSRDFCGVETNFLYIDKAVTQIILAPGQFDVIVTTNLFGDILCGALRALAKSEGERYFFKFSHGGGCR
ncbi:MAG: isocitrate/isopropylmalate family dehydrogenase [Treponema sp.]|nr:isocitrate/isopropylmalate family dehydrogenase [Treponema sp.]